MAPTAMASKILVPTDFSAPALGALDHAASLAKADGATLHLVHAVDRVHFSKNLAKEYANAANIDQLLEKETAAATAKLEKLAAPLRRKKLKVEVSAHAGEPAKEILRAAKRTKADLVVMGTHGHTGLMRLLMGSVAEKVVREAPCPVITLRAKSGRARKQA